MPRPLKDIWASTIERIRSNPELEIQTALTLIAAEELALPDRPNRISPEVWADMVGEVEQGKAGFAQSQRGMLLPTSEDRREQLAISLAMLHDAGYPLSGPGDDRWPVFGVIAE